ncbi:hypothetical protein FA15DRAFT_705585 [Coprinopsis marcescibilis]|uniref:CHAT domain-containing protein n=1 Tax=Coprinopsis marcescibilis TaxID=230819 RepID=A0A5C3L541_COPMA|nr:hypothetical protein FA15DRAFT_705585 [Coprinopsis marcescibilis]
MIQVTEQAPAASSQMRNVLMDIMLSYSQDEQLDFAEICDFIKTAVQKCKNEMDMDNLDKAITSLENMSGQFYGSAEFQRLVCLASAGLTKYFRYGWICVFETTLKLMAKIGSLSAANQKPASKHPEIVRNGAIPLDICRKSFNIELVDCAIEYCIDMLPFCTQDNPQRADLLRYTSESLVMRYLHRRNPADCFSALSYFKEVAQLTPPQDCNRYERLMAVCHVASIASIELHAQWAGLQIVEFYQKAIGVDHEASQAMTEGVDLLRRIQTGKDSACIERSISSLSASLRLRPFPHPQRSLSLNNLASALYSRFDLEGSSTDLEEGIIYHNEALSLRPHPHPERPPTVYNLCKSLLTRFSRNGSLLDLDRAVLLSQAALRDHPTADPGHAGWLKTLADALIVRGKQKGTVDDFDEAAKLYERVISLGPATDLERADAWTSFARAMSLLSSHRPVHEYKQKTVSVLREAVKTIPRSNPNYLSQVHSLGCQLRELYSETKNLSHLEESTYYLQEVCNSVQPTQAERMTPFLNLALSHEHHFMETGSIHSLEQAISAHRDALSATPPSHGQYPLICSRLGRALLYKFQRLEPKNPSSQLLKESISLLKAAAKSPVGSIRDRLEIAQWWALSAWVFRPASSLEAYEYSISLLPLLVSFDMTLKERQDVLIHHKDLACNATKCAIENREFEKAVTFLTNARSVFWSQAMQLSSHIHDNRFSATGHPLYQRLLEISNELEQASHSSAMPAASSAETWGLTGAIRNEEPLYYQNLSDEWYKLVGRIRQTKGFEGFMQPRSFASIQKAAGQGPVVLLNASAQRGCDALIMTSDSIEWVPLKEMSVEKLDNLKKVVRQLTSGRSVDEQTLEALREMRDIADGDGEDVTVRLKGRRVATPGRGPDDLFRVTLEIIWKTVVQPVILRLGLKKTAGQPIQRIWWCPTGPLTFLPIHAAGVYSEGSNEDIDCLSSYAISSYCTTPQDLLFESQNPPTSEEDDSEFKLLAIIQPEVPNANSLPYTQTELQRILNHLPKLPNVHFTQRIGTKSSPTSVERVLRDLGDPQLGLVHFGCHGMLNTTSPLESPLLLSGGRLTMGKIIKERRKVGKSLGGALAYLSACETASVDEVRPDESLSLAATMLFAGFKGVVATMWSIYDKDAPVLADSFYGHFLGSASGRSSKKPDVTDAARALHLAVQDLKKTEKSFLHWVPFVHFGI